MTVTTVTPDIIIYTHLRICLYDTGSEYHRRYDRRGSRDHPPRTYGIVILMPTIGIAVFKGVVNTWFRSMMPRVHAVSGVSMLAAGVYIVYYWLIKGDLIESVV